MDAGSITGGSYRNHTLGFACKVPPGWVFRTDDMNAPQPEAPPDSADSPQNTAQGASANGRDASSGTVLLAAFSRPPEAAGEDVNASIVIAAEKAGAYPGLKDAAQYFGPLTEVATAQGFKLVNQPYQFTSGTRTVVRADFARDRGTKVMRQATLVLLSHGYALSFTFIAGTEDELEELIQGLSFAGTPSTASRHP